MDLISRYRKSRSKRTWHTIRDDILKDFPCVLRKLNMLDMEVFFCCSCVQGTRRVSNLTMSYIPQAEDRLVHVRWKL
jgi:hypothetical protein